MANGGQITNYHSPVVTPRLYGGGQFVINQPYLYSISEGDIAGHTPLHKPAYQGSVSTSMIDVWGLAQVYVPPASAMQMSVRSSDNTQDKAGGTGALTVEIHYLDNAYAEQTESITLNGTTWVDTSATNILRINGFHVTHTGSGGYPVGNISVVDKASRAITYSYIALGYNRAFSSFWTVPAGKTLYIVCAMYGCSSSASKNADFILKTTTMEGVLTDEWFGVDRVLTQDNTVSKRFCVPLKIPAQADIKMSVKGSGSLAVTCGYEGWYE